MVADCVEAQGRAGYSANMSTAEKLFLKARSLPEEAQDAVLRVVEQLAVRYPAPAAGPLTMHEAAELRGRLAAWEEDWDSPGMEVYDQP